MASCQTCIIMLAIVRIQLVIFLANYARMEGRPIVWLRSGPPNTIKLCNEEFKPNREWVIKSLPTKK